MSRPIRVRDPIHGFIRLREQSELRLVNHPVFQRLRRIRQLAMAYLAFPGAQHTRFDHSLGVLHIASLIGETMEPGLSEDQTTNLRLAALCHDIGHGPFSHISEFAFEACAPQGGETEKLHEQITRAIVQRVLPDRGLMLPDQAQEVAAILKPQEGLASVLKDAVSGPLDADKLDYLLRDSYFSGVKYGVYDLDRLLSAVTRIDDGPESHIGVRPDDVPAVDQYVLAKHNMGQVYYHKVRRVADAMLVRSVVLACEEGNDGVADIYELSDLSDPYLERYLETDDEWLVQRVLAYPDRPSASLMQRLRERRLVKEVFREPLYACGDAAFREMVQTVQGKKDLEKEIANRCSKSQPEVFIDLQQGRPLRKGAGEQGPEAILVKDPRVGRRNYDEVSAIFRFGAHWDHDYISVYTPVDGQTDGQRTEDRARSATVAQEVLRFEARAGQVNICPRCGKPLPGRPEGCCTTCGEPLGAISRGGEADA